MPTQFEYFRSDQTNLWGSRNGGTINFDWEYRLGNNLSRYGNFGATVGNPVWTALFTARPTNTAVMMCIRVK